jgi:hypothetical protein
MAFSALWLAVAGAALVSPGCYGHNCDGAFVTYGADAGEGHMIDENTWESNAPSKPWLPFPRQRYYLFDLHALGGRTPALVVPYVSAQSSPGATGADFTVGSGNLTLLFNAQPNRIDVKNDSCSDYFLRLVVSAAPLPSAPEDSGTSLGTAIADAGNDARADADAGSL